MKRLRNFLFLLPLLPGCMSHAVRVEPISVAPVHVTMDVTLHVEDARTAQGGETEGAETQGGETEGAETQGGDTPAATPDM